MSLAMAARETIVQVDRVVELGSIDLEAVVTPGIFVQKVVSSPITDLAFEEAAA